MSNTNELENTLKLQVLTDNLKDALGLVGRAIPSKSTLPVIQNVYLEASDPGDELHMVRITGTNLEIEITKWMPAKIEGLGRITLPAKTLRDLVWTLDQGAIGLELDERTQTVNLTQFDQNVSSKIKGVDAAEYPPPQERFVPDGETKTIEMRGFELRELVKKALVCVSDQESRPTLTAVFCEITNGELIFVSADGFRLGAHKYKLDGGEYDDMSFLLPSKSLAEALRVFKDEDDILLHIPKYPNPNLVIFQSNDVQMVIRLQEGNFPNWREIIPRDHTTSATVDRGQLHDATARAHIFARDGSLITSFKFSEQENNIRIKALSEETGSVEDFLSAEVEGGTLRIDFNSQFLKDIISSIDEERIVFEGTGSTNPGVIRPEIDYTKSIFIIMPMFTGDD